MSIEEEAKLLEPFRQRASQGQLIEVSEIKAAYGLKNLHQRLRLFYGEDCGLTVAPSEGGGLKVRIIARAMTCEEYENNHSLHSTLKEEDFHENHHRQPD